MIDFYFDFVSPFGYFASLRIEAWAARHRLDVRWHPILIGVTVMKVMGLPPVFDIPLKGGYIKRELDRYRRMNGITLRRDPNAPPVSGLAASRAMALLNRRAPESAAAFAHAAYRAYWQEERDLNRPDVIAEIAHALGLGGGVAQDLAGESAREALREEMEAAVARGVFGSPFFLIDDEPFFGVDKFESMEHWLALGRP